MKQYIRSLVIFFHIGLLTLYLYACQSCCPYNTPVSQQQNIDEIALNSISVADFMQKLNKLPLDSVIVFFAGSTLQITTVSYFETNNSNIWLKPLLDKQDRK